MRSVSLPRAVSMMIGISPLSLTHRVISRPSTFGQHEVEHHQLGLCLLQHFEGGGAVGGDHHFVPGSIEVQADDLGDARLVFHDKDQRVPPILMPGSYPC